MSQKYYCSDCKLAVIVTTEGDVIRACNCTGAIVAEASSTLQGNATLNA